MYGSSYANTASRKQLVNSATSLPASEEHSQPKVISHEVESGNSGPNFTPSSCWDSSLCQISQGREAVDVVPTGESPEQTAGMTENCGEKWRGRGKKGCL